MIELLLDFITFISIESIKKSRFIRGVAFIGKFTTYVAGIPSNLTKHWQQELEPRWWNTREMIFKVGRLTLYFS